MRFVITMLLAFVAITAEAQDSSATQVGADGIYYQFRGLDGDISNRAYVQGWRQYKTRPFGAWWNLYGESKYVSMGVGPYVDLMEIKGATLGAGLALGFECIVVESDCTNFGRYSSIVSLEKEDRFLFELYYEIGPSDETRNFWTRGWSRLDLSVELNESFTVGALGQTGDGIGPRVGVKLWDQKLRVWVVPHTWTLESKKFASQGTFLLGAEITWSRTRQDIVSALNRDWR